MSLTPATTLSQAVIQNAALLRRLADTARPIATKAALAAELGRDPGNSHRALKALQAEGIVDGLALTDLGRRVLRGLDVAEGNIAPPTLADTGPGWPPLTPRWPIGQCRPNPANRSIDDNDPGLHDLAESIIGAGDILQPLILTPVDDDGIRMILAGERRWRAARILAAGGDTPPALTDGLPFTERAATAAEALLITIVENSQRQDLTPWEDARLLLQLADETGWTGAELARRIGRSGPDNRGGAKDVQDKLKIAREATPQAIATYELTGSWDALRNSVRTPKPADPDQTDLETHLADTPAPRGERINGTTTADGTTWPIIPDETLSPDWIGGPRAEIRLTRSSDDRWHVHLSTEAGPPTRHYQGDARGVYETDPTFTTRHDALRHAAHRIRRQLGDAINNRLRDWLESILNPDGDPLVVNGVRQPNATRANEARVALGLIARPSNSGSGRNRDAEYAAAGDPSDPPPHLTADAAPAFSRLIAAEELILLELAIKTNTAPVAIEHDAVWTDDPAGDLPAFGCAVGSYWLDPLWAGLVTLGLARVVHRAGGTPPLAGLTDRGANWLLDQLDAGIPSATPETLRVDAFQRAELPPVQTAHYVTPWIETEAAAADITTPHPDTAPDSPATDADAWDRDHNAIAADRALLTRVTDMVAGVTTPSVTHRRDLLAALGFEGPFGTADGRIISAMPVDALQPTPLAVVDRAHDLPDDRAQALALIVAWALNRAFNPGADQ